ncbi:ABC transporter substrate-binding protein [Gluconobacter roseus NBRC 3990]|uniref:ABC transporter substrate-binding protein n=2 Tax=Gluconobacter roseus TaxID=586239 RepID=A0A4Y3M7J6_9PROT|nr:peptide ABC transporter [Gluconobacter roseus NBRC 3990]GEB03251.1 ABC transporter substrate-binding protein [Gluconobacter roseus NBRC 3990]GLP93709.1 ABC transporter substrate-binding protein [Gluconobacter roseus NBRC 3990]
MFAERLMKTLPIFMAVLTAGCSALLCPASARAEGARDTLSIGLAIEPPGLDPTRGSSEAIGMVTYGNIYEGLMRLNEHGALRPLLAQNWSVSSDGLINDFTLHNGVHFHDGTELTCESVKFSLLRAGAMGSTNPNRAVFSRIADISCPDSLHVRIRLHHPYGSFLYQLAGNDAAILSPASVDQNISHPVGTGPFVFDEWRRGDHLTLRRNPDYWGSKPALNSVTFRFMPDPLSASNALLAGELDAYPSFPSREILSRFSGNRRLEVVRGSFPFKAILALNNARRPFNDPRVRQAIAQAVDRKALIQAVAESDATVLQSHMAPDDPDYVSLPDRYPYDPEHARALLKEAGVSPGTHLTLTFPPIGYARDSSELIAAYLEQVGLTVTLQPVEWPAWLGRVYGQGQFDMTVIAHTEPHDINIYDRTPVYFHYHSPVFHDLLEQYEATADTARRHELSVQMQEQLATDEPNVYLFSIPRQTVMDRRIRGIWANQPIAGFPVADVFWAP